MRNGVFMIGKTLTEDINDENWSEDGFKVSKGDKENKGCPILKFKKNRRILVGQYHTNA
jgi:hypothetical protein